MIENVLDTAGEIRQLGTEIIVGHLAEDSFDFAVDIVERFAAFKIAERVAKLASGEVVKLFEQHH